MASSKLIKYIVLVLFLTMTIVSIALMGDVKINYNISDYLDDSTETKISLDIIESNFGSTGNIQVMVEDVTVEQAQEISKIIKNIDNVLLVNFDQADPSYYKDGDALFAVIVNGDEYSDTAKKVYDDIKTNLNNYLENETHYGGAVVEKLNMRNSLKTEMVLILAIALVFAFGIMLLMAKSWIEPLVLLASSGVAVFINLGTNVFFDDVSYITNAVAAILQLALSVDYSIILLHEYRRQKAIIPDNDKAMISAIKKSIKAIFASALTTIFGLIALFFMTMKIGYDIGIVLTKGIIISAITAVMLLPVLILLCDKLMLITAKKDLVLSGKALCKIAFKSRVPIVALALVLIILGGVLHMGNSYSFTDTANPNKTIIDKFGASNTIVVVYPNERLNWNDETTLANALKEFKTAEDKAPFQYLTGYSTTVIEPYSIEKAANKLNVSPDLMKMLFAMYHADNNEAQNREINSIDFVNFAINALDNGSGEDNPNAEMLRTLQILSSIHQIVNGNHTADEMYDLVSTGVMSSTGLTKFQIDQMYGLYLWDKFDNANVTFETMLDYMVELSEDPDGKTLMSEKTAADLKELADGLEDFKEKMNAELTEDGFVEFGKNEFGDHWWVQPACATVFTLAGGGSDTITTIELLSFVDQVPGIPKNYKDMIKNYSYVYDVIDENCSYTDFIPVLKKVILALSEDNKDREIEPTEQDVQQGYIMYFREKRDNAIRDEKIKGIDFVKFVNETIETNPTVAGKVTEESKAKLLDVATIDKFISDYESYDYAEMTERLNTLRSEVKSVTSGDGEPTPVDESDILTIYSLYVEENKDGDADPIVALDLLNYVENHKGDSLKKYFDENPELEIKITERKEAILKAEELFRSKDAYNRLLISVDLDSEGEESSKFGEYLLNAVREVYGPEAHIAGHMVSTVDLQNTFERDNTIITLVTIICIFLIIMLVFRSLSLPVVLVLIIQGAIWISMATSLLTGPMFFMSYIITTCILMGATIDYGILMSSTYVDARATLDKKEALKVAVDTALPTVFTSGVILTVCGFIVGFVATQKSIATVGILLGKGALVSSLMIVLVLPSVLYLLDKVILKLTIRKKVKTVEEIEEIEA